MCDLFSEPSMLLRRWDILLLQLQHDGDRWIRITHAARAFARLDWFIELLEIRYLRVIVGTLLEAGRPARSMKSFLGFFPNVKLERPKMSGQMTHQIYYMDISGIANLCRGLA